MDLHSSFETLSNVLKEFDRNGRSVRRVAITADRHGPVSASVELRVSIGDLFDGDSPLSVSASTASIDDVGPVFTFRLEDLPSTLFPDIAERDGDDGPGISISPNDVETADGKLLIDLRVDVVESGSPDGTASHSFSPPASREATDTERDEAEYERKEIESALDAVRNESVPAYEDTAYLSRLYELAETFDQMSDVIELDVSAETVRRYMMDAGVHVPGPNAKPDRSESGEATDGSRETFAQPTRSAQTPSAQESEASTSVRTGASQPEPAQTEPDCAESLPTGELITDGVGLPDDVTLRELAEIVSEARTVHEVHRRLDLDHDGTRELLRQLNVLDLVVTRAFGEAERDVTFEAVAERIREST